MSDMHYDRRDFLKLGVATGITLLGDTHSIHATQEARRRPVIGFPPHPSIDEMEAGFARWQRMFPDRMKIESRGRSKKGRPLTLVRITDESVADDDKQVALFTTCHSGEYMSVLGVLELTKWLLSDDPRAVEIRRRQVVLIMPTPDPDYYMADGSRDAAFWGWDWNGVKFPKNKPEAVAIEGVINEYMPDAYMDVHGLLHDRCTNLTPSYVLEGPFHPDVVIRLRDAAEKAGLFFPTFEELSGRARASRCSLESDTADHFLAPGPYSKTDAWPNMFAYHKYHTLSFLSENCDPRIVLVTAQALLEMGHDKWRLENYPGYPVNQLGISSGVGLTAWGATARQRRLSRVELWQKIRQFAYGTLNSELPGKKFAWLSTNPAMTADFPRKWVPTSVLADKISKSSDFNARPVLKFLDEVAHLTLDNARSKPVVREAGLSAFVGSAKPDQWKPIKNGAAMRLTLPFPKARIKHLTLNGYPVKESATDGYSISHEACTIVQINIPPAKVRDLHVVTCEYDPMQKLHAGWEEKDWKI